MPEGKQKRKKRAVCGGFLCTEEQTLARILGLRDGGATDEEIVAAFEKLREGAACEARARASHRKASENTCGVHGKA